ncbi:SDR family oxidoreductase [Waddlia chondrophila]|uniref:Short chain dehydrogenase/reductase family protein n=1 Tax=Waddlia chondrophila (strain ATCC VR-1470 / WSU 86-1044) TaxID=716544 RepID=D6YRX2_WADCW|nr:NAD(P)-dependent oxidoreductase [Waddlia chondrophila]ADI38817.1 short chain dehydrogenase/reductase family protein [Waddlia chondrophila WSU 86-1044]
MSLKGRTVLITGASRGIGEAIALRCAEDGANVVVAAKTSKPHPTLPGTIHTVAEEIEKRGGKALAVQVDIRNEDQVKSAVEQALESFGGIDILINNASAIFPTATLDTPMKKFDLMVSCNMRATFLCSKLCLPHLITSENPHILNLSPPLSYDPKWLKPHVAYTMSKYGMTMCTLGMAEEFREQGVAVNSLWPKTTIATQAIKAFFPFLMDKSRKPSIMADAAYHIVTQESKVVTGNCFLDEEVLIEHGITEFDQYAQAPGQELQIDLFVESSV